ncbi:MAG: hypothetical protein M1823_005861, partial [Watsoniomyces obsoletus]
NVWPVAIDDLLPSGECAAPEAGPDGGRPKKKRRRRGEAHRPTVAEQGALDGDLDRPAIAHCGICREPGHDRRTCPIFHGSILM